MEHSSRAGRQWRTIFSSIPAFSSKGGGAYFVQTQGPQLLNLHVLTHPTHNPS